MFDLDTYNQTKDLSGGPIVTVKFDDPVRYIEAATDERGNVSKAGMVAYLIAYAVAAGALAYWFWM